MLALVIVALAAPASAQAAFTFVGTLSAAGQHARDPQVGVDADGDSVFVWSRFNGAKFLVQARARSVGGTLGAVQTLSAPGQSAIDPQVGVESNGDALVVWSRFDGTTQCGGFQCLRIQVQARSASGTLSPVQTVSPPGLSAGIPQVAVDSQGDAVVVWRSTDSTSQCEASSCDRIQAIARAAGGGLSAVQTLSGPTRTIVAPQVGIDSDGDAVFVWERRGGTTQCPPPNGRCGLVESRARSQAGGLSAVQVLGVGPFGGATPQVDVDPTADAVFAWRFFDTTTDCGGGASCAQVQTRARTAAGALSSVQALSARGRQAVFPEVAVDSVGDAVFTWRLPDLTTQCGGPPCLRIQGRARSATGTLSAVQNLSAPGRDADAPDVGVDSDGDAVFVWQRFDGTNTRVQARSRSTAGTLGAIGTLSAPGHAFDPRIAVAPNGAASAVWTRDDGSNDRIEAAVQPSPS